MRLKDDFILHNTGEDFVIIATGEATKNFSDILSSFIQETLEKIVFIKMFSSEKKISNISTDLQHNLFSSQMKGTI